MGCRVCGRVACRHTAGIHEGAHGIGDVERRGPSPRLDKTGGRKKANMEAGEASSKRISCGEGDVAFGAVVVCSLLPAVASPGHLQPPRVWECHHRLTLGSRESSPCPRTETPSRTRTPPRPSAVVRARNFLPGIEAEKKRKEREGRIFTEGMAFFRRGIKTPPAVSEAVLGVLGSAAAGVSG